MAVRLLTHPRSSTTGLAARSAATVGTSRRTVLTRGLWAFAGAIGAGVAGSSVLGTGRLLATPAAKGAGPIPASDPGELTITAYVRDVRFAAPDVKPGQLPDPTAARSPHGVLVDGAGAAMGSLSGGVLPGSAGRIGVHRFTFDDGTLVGMGSGRLDDDDYAVVGGTGRFAGVSGSYHVKLRDGECGRDAEFAITITGAKG